MLNKRAQELRVPVELVSGLWCGGEQFYEFGGSEIGHRVGLGVTPNGFHRVQFRCIGRPQVGAHEVLGDEPVGDRNLVESSWKRGPLGSDTYRDNHLLTTCSDAPGYPSIPLNVPPSGTKMEQIFGVHRHRNCLMQRVCAAP